MAQESKEANIGKEFMLPDSAGMAYFGGAARAVREAWGLPNQVKTVEEGRRRLGKLQVAGIAALGLLAAAAVGGFAYRVAVEPPEGVALDGSSFPDAALLEVAAVFDSDGNGYLSRSEAAAVSELDLSGRGIADATGIASFPNLHLLDLSDNDLQALDVSGVVGIVKLDVSGNRISDLDLSGHEALGTLYAGNNGMQSLTLTGCAALEVVDTAGNSLARLDLRDCPGIQFISIDARQNVTLPLVGSFFPDENLQKALAPYDVDEDGALSLRERQAVTALDLSDTDASSLSGLEWLDALQSLKVSNTGLAALLTTNLPASLTSLVANGCKIEQADLLGLPRLATLDLGSNPLAAVDLSALPRLTKANFSGCALEGVLDVTQNTRLEHLDVSGNPGLVQVNAWGVGGLAEDGAVVADEGCTVLYEEPVPGELPGEPVPGEEGVAEGTEGEEQA